MKALLIISGLFVCALGMPHVFSGWSKGRMTQAHPYHELVKRAKGPVECDESYERISNVTGQFHPRCQYLRKGKRVNVTKDDVALILGYHNKFRMDDVVAEKVKSVKNMCKMYWDPHLAEQAQFWAEACPEFKTSVKGVATRIKMVPGYGQMNGQNVAFGAGPNQKRWRDIVKLWFKDHKYFKWGVGSTEPEQSVGPFIKIILPHNCRVGCGSALCDYEDKKDMPVDVCNYYDRAWTKFHAKPIRKKDRGKPCSGCPDHCVEKKLCDTKGKVCYNGGVMNYKTVKCKCHPHYTGKYCETRICYGDHERCRKPEVKDECALHRIDLQIDCPIACGICSKDCKAGKNFTATPPVGIFGGLGKNIAVYPGGGIQVLKGHEDCKTRKGAEKAGLDALEEKDEEDSEDETEDERRKKWNKKIDIKKKRRIKKQKRKRY